VASHSEIRLAFDVIESFALHGGADWLLMETEQDWQALGFLMRLEAALGSPGPYLADEVTSTFSSGWSGEAGWRACSTFNEALRYGLMALSTHGSPTCIDAVIKDPELEAQRLAHMERLASA
jgi:hypothetical protein